MAGTFCTHFAISHKAPKNDTDCYDNASIVIEHIEAIFGAIWTAHTNEFTGSLAVLGEELCSELRQRLDVLYHWQESEAAQERKEA